MTNRRRQDPYRRSPPTIDLTASELPVVGAPADRLDPAAPTDTSPVAETVPVPPSDTAGTLTPDAGDAASPMTASPPATGGSVPATGGTVPVTGGTVPADAGASDALLAGGAGMSDSPGTPANAQRSDALAVEGSAPADDTRDAPTTTSTAARGFGASDEPASTGSGVADEPSPFIAAAAASPGAEAAREPVAPARRGFGSLLAASLLGGAVGAGLVYGGETWWRDQHPSPLEGRIAALEARPVSGDPAALERRVGTVETQLRTLSEGVRTATERAASAAPATQAPAPVAAPAAPPAPQPDAEARRQIEAVSARLAAIESTARSAETTARSADNTARAAATGQALADLSGQLAPLQEAARLTSANAGAITDVRTRLDRLQAETTDRVGANANAVTTLRDRVGALDGRIAQQGSELAKLPPATMQAGLRAIVAGQVADALRAGTPVGPALATLTRLGTEAGAVAPLRPYADAAPPTATALAADFKPLADRMTAEPNRPAGTIGERLLRMADKIVTVRDVGDGSGSDVPGLVARIEASLARGALADAASAWDRLPDGSRQMSADWGARLKARNAADAAAHQIATGALAALDAPAR